MSYPLPDQTITTTDRFTVSGIQDPISEIGWFEFQNETSYSLAVQMGAYQFQIPAWTGWPISTEYSGAISLPIQVQPKTILNYQSTAPGNTLSTIVYRRGERPAHTQPYTLARQTNLGNTIPVGTQVSQVINTGNTAPTAVLSGTPSGAPSPEAVINNDGSATLGGGNVTLSAAGVFTLPASAVPVASIAAGALPSGVTVPGAQVSSAVNDALTLNSVFSAGSDSANSVLHSAQPAGTPQGFFVNTWNGSAVTGAQLMTSAGLRLSDQVSGGAYNASGDTYGFPNQAANGASRFRSTTTFTGTGPGTYNHNFATLSGGGTPNFIGITSNEANSTETVGVDSLGSSTVHVNMPQAWPFYGFAART